MSCCKEITSHTNFESLLNFLLFISPRVLFLDQVVETCFLFSWLTQLCVESGRYVRNVLPFSWHRLGLRGNAVSVFAQHFLF